MAASYPAGFDTMSDPSANLSGPPLHSTMHNQINDVLEAIEAELGLNPSGADATVAATLAALASRYVSLTGGVLLVNNASQSIPTSSVTDVVWPTETSDPDGWTAGGIALLTVPAGKGMRYACTYSGQWSSAPTTQTIAAVINGTPTYEAPMGSAGVGTNWIATLSFIRTLAAGDTIKITVAQSSGSSRNINSRLEIAPV